MHLFDVGVPAAGGVVYFIPVNDQDCLSISEIFLSLQGESTLAGKPCLFIRLAGCDLRCAWCDTSYALESGTRMTLSRIMEEVRKYPVQLVELTGGEPLLQENSYRLMGLLLDEGRKVMLETGGHRTIAKVDRRIKIIYDIKCPGSGMSDRNMWENLLLLKPSDEIKFVIASEADYRWAENVIREYSLGSRHEILFSPVSGVINPRDLAEWILRDNLPVRMQLQLHRVIWGDERGR